MSSSVQLEEKKSKSKFSPPRFSVKHTEFSKVLNERVNEYFRKHGVSRYGQSRMVWKLIAMSILYLSPLVALLVIQPQQLWLQLVCWAVAGLGMAGMGFTVMHDANHGVMHKNKRFNKVAREVIVLIGASGLNWRIQHNILHHTYTNVHGMDEDIMVNGIFRLSPDQKRAWMHRFQHLYAWPLYSLMTLTWCTYRDFIKLGKYIRLGLVSDSDGSPAWLYTRLVIERIIYFGVFLVLPLLVLPSVLFTVLGFLLMHLVCSLILTAVIQSAHVVAEVDHPGTNEDNEITHGWAEHQLLTTINFGNRSRFLTWFVGGLNYQVEHHLFPNISQIHYPKLAPIVRKTAEEFSLPYYSCPSIWSALWTHERMLYRLGRRA